MYDIFTYIFNVPYMDPMGICLLRIPKLEAQKIQFDFLEWIISRFRGFLILRYTHK